jgi:exodeoxyribonuclease VII large subunit
MLERGFSALWVEGELSNLSRPSSGHWYFSLKDDNAQLRCAMFRMKNQLIRFAPKDGMHVQVRGRVSLYEARGDYQFLVDHMEEAGEGALRRRFELLKAKLAAEGLFAQERKRALPTMPRRIGVITSPTGAAVRDVLHILRRRFCTIPVLIYPVPVQGAAAAPQIAAAIRLASMRAECDVLVLARGGGSLEDLWAFNEEVVARAIYECSIPIVSGIGHEVDFTIADLVADLRAPTPSGAAERIAPDCEEWTRTFTQSGRRLAAALQRQLARRVERVVWLTRRLNQLHPGVELKQKAQRLDELEQSLLAVFARQLAQSSDRVAWLTHRLAQVHPGVELRRRSQRLNEVEQRLATGLRRHLQRDSQRIAWLERRLSQVHPGAEVKRRSQQIQEIESRLTRGLRHLLLHRRSQLGDAASRLRHVSPAPRLGVARTRLHVSEARIAQSITKRLESLRTRCTIASGRLNTVSPLATLQRGYAIVTNAIGEVVTDANTLKTGDVIEAQLAQGKLRARIESSGAKQK